MNPTRRLVLAVLKYPLPFSAFELASHQKKPPKCYFDSEKPIVDWALEPFAANENEIFSTERDDDGKPKHRSLDCSLMECADDIAYGVHDLEDIVARDLVRRDEVLDVLRSTFRDGNIVGPQGKGVRFSEFEAELFGESHTRKALIGKLVNLFITSTEVTEHPKFDHPLLKFRVDFQPSVHPLLQTLKNLTRDLVIKRAEVQQLERRGKKIVSGLYAELLDDPTQLIPDAAWRSLNPDDPPQRRVCDYVAGMTDLYAQRIYQRLFIPGVGSSHDEL